MSKPRIRLHWITYTDVYPATAMIQGFPWQPPGEWQNAGRYWSFHSLYAHLGIRWRDALRDQHGKGDE